MVEVKASNFLFQKADYGNRECCILYKCFNNTYIVLLLDTFEKMMVSGNELHNITYVFREGDMANG